MVEDLADVDMDRMGPAEADLAFMMFPHLADLKLINTLARKEMAQLAPPMLAESYPAAG